MSDETNLNFILAYLKSKGVPKSMIKTIRETLAYDAVKNGKLLCYDRIYTALAIAVRRTYGFGFQRIMRVVQEFENVCGDVLENDAYWPDLMKELDDELGVIFRTGPDGRVCVEYSRDNEIDVHSGEKV